MTEVIIFDLDSCLAAADAVGEQLFAPAFAGIRVVAECGCARSVSREPVGERPREPARQ